jgi:hypothetical protein
MTTATGPEPCLGTYKAVYAYTAQGEDEVSVEEDQLVFLLDNSDDEYVVYSTLDNANADLHMSHQLA